MKNQQEIPFAQPIGLQMGSTKIPDKIFQLMQKRKQMLMFKKVSTGLSHGNSKMHSLRVHGAILELISL